MYSCAFNNESLVAENKNAFWCSGMPFWLRPLKMKEDDWEYTRTWSGMQSRDEKKQE